VSAICRPIMVLFPMSMISSHVAKAGKVAMLPSHPSLSHWQRSCLRDGICCSPYFRGTSETARTAPPAILRGLVFGHTLVSIQMLRFMRRMVAVAQASTT
jgi:hypothetical protein